MSHRDEIKYADARSELTSKIRRRWKRDPTGSSAEGPCPACEGDAWGPALPVLEVDEVPADAPPPGGGDIPCRCHCNHDHGKGAELGCGRHFVYEVNGGS